MGTRGFLGFVGNGKSVITYNHYDSYPSHLGVNVLAWLCQVDDFELVKVLIESMREVDDNRNPPTRAQMEGLKDFSDLGVMGNIEVQPNWYQVLRNTQGDPEAILTAGFYEDASKFPLDSVFCEWGYLIDTDAGVLEVYRGFQHEPHHEGRFAQLKAPERPNAGIGKYYPVKLIASFPLGDLPSDEEFLRAVDTREED